MKPTIQIWLLILLSLPNLLKAQCGVDPTSGTTTINTASQIPNSFYPGQGNPLVNTSSLTVGTLDARGNATAIAPGDLILIIQMQGADINSSNSDSYGDGVSTGPAAGYLTSNLVAGRFEYNTVSTVVGSTINLAYSLANSYFTRTFASGGIQTYQVVRIPRSFNITITGSGSVTCPAWNGGTGGIVALDAANVLTINGSINVNSLGFRGGGGINLTGATTGNTNGSSTLTNTDYRWDSPFSIAANLSGGSKGEGIAGTSVYVLATGATTITTNSVDGYIGGSMGRGAPGNGGGGGTDGSPIGASQNQYNSGGGGGGNAGTGGLGGSGWHGSGGGDVNTYPTGGYGGVTFTHRSLQQIIMGGGGGAGTANNSTAAEQYMSSGGAGGGIILLRAKSYAGTGSLNANGADAIGVTGSGGNTDAAGGGGAGGTIVAVTRQNVTVGLTTVSANARGGKGGNMETYYDHGPGGGGGGGFIVTNGVFGSTNITAGINGLTRSTSTSGAINNTYGAMPGSVGQVLTLSSAPTLKNYTNGTSPCGVLPITLISFRGSVNGSVVLLNWDISNAINFSHLEIEYSYDGSSFATIGTVAFHSLQTAYQFTHSNVVAPINYYRLKMINNNGSFTYSKILVMRSEGNTNEITVYPQPAREYISVGITANKAQRITLQLFNASGSKVKEVQMQLNGRNNLFIIDKLQGLSPGMYILKTIVDEKQMTARVVINN